MITYNFDIGGKKITLYASAVANRPLVVLHTFEGDGENIVTEIRALGPGFDANSTDFNLLVICTRDWEDSMTPWPCPPLYKKDEPFTGGADRHLDWLQKDVLPKMREFIKGTPAHTAIAGYSLAGLFSLYALYACPVFDRAACMSASFWFPGFEEFVLQNEMRRVPDRLYISLGAKEAKTKQPLLKTVQDCTEGIVAHCKDLGVDATFELNEGNHFTDVEWRIAKGIMAVI